MLNGLRHTLRQAAWAPLAVFIFYLLVAKGFGAYRSFPWLDMLIHFFGGLAITYFFLVAIDQLQVKAGDIPPCMQWIGALGLAAITAIAWEILELLADQVLGTALNEGVIDTLADLFFDLFGGIIMIAIVYWRQTSAALCIAPKQR